VEPFRVTLWFVQRLPSSPIKIACAEIVAECERIDPIRLAIKGGEMG
jgi:hypothetical protein